jgi:hypothetical protein
MRRKIASSLKRLSRKNRVGGGFSLPDLLVGGAITTLVVSASGYGVVAMADASATANAKSERRIEMNRSVDFMASEVRLADKVSNKDASLDAAKEKMDVYLADNPDARTKLQAQIDTGTIEPVLAVTLSGTNTPILYYIAEPKDGQWSGPKVVYRWGPAFDVHGYYLNDWRNEPLLDKLVKREGSSSVGEETSSDWEPSCPSGWTGSGTVGFSACVNGSEKIAKIEQKGKLHNDEDRNENLSVSADMGARGVTVQSIEDDSSSGTARSFTEASASSSPSSDPSSSPSSDPSSSPSPKVTTPVLEISKVNGGVVPNVESTMKVQLLGGDITCGAGGPNIPTSATINLTGGTSLTQAVPTTGEYTYTVAANTSINITGVAQGNSSSGGCKSHYMMANSSTSQGSQVLTVLDGNTVPVFTPVAGQRTIDAFLAPYIDSSTGKVKLAPNQAIFLFELGTTSKSSSAYDMQDLVVLVTLTPNQTTTTASTSGSSSSGSSSSGSSSSGSSSGSSNNGCNNGLGNGSEGCTPGNARPNDEIVTDSSGNVLCTPAPGNPCTQASKTVSTSKKKK